MTIETYSAKYLDGISSKPQEVEVVVQIDGLDIYTRDAKHILWHYKDIEKQELGNSILNNKYPRESLLFTKEDFEKLRSHKYLHNQLRTKFFWLLANNDKFVIPLLLFIIISFFTIYFWGTKILTKAVMPFIGKKTEISWGKTLSENMLQNEEINENATVFINKYWKQLNLAPADTNVHITVVSDDIMNAYALPGGNIVVYDSIIRIMHNHEELSALLAHEYIHTRNRHSMQILLNSLSRTVIISLFFGSNSASVMQNVDVVNQLHYNRGLEKEADIEGLQLLANAHRNVNGMPELFTNMNKAVSEDKEDEIKFGGNTYHIPEFLQTHPSLTHRIDYTKKIIKQYPKKYEESPLEEIFYNIEKSCRK